GAHKIIAIEMNDRDLLARFYAEGVRRIPELNFTYSSDQSIEIVASGVSKGSALQYLAEHLGIPPQAILAIGDSENDLDMIQYAGTGVAVGNALESVRAVANRVVKSSKDNGVAQAIWELVLPPGENSPDRFVEAA
ncbi:MAG: HAD family hydrolase, partial [Omnitrophica WOR_2 bacterium]